GRRAETARVERRGELARPHEQLARTGERLAGERTATCVRELGRGLLGEVRGCPSIELGEQPARLVEMESADLDELLPRPLAEPVREQEVEVGARALRESGVRDLPDEHVLELEGLLAADRRAILAQNEVPEEQVVDDGVDVLDLGGEVREGATQEDAAHDGRALREPAGLRRQTVNA